MKSRKRLPISLWVVQQTKLIPPSKARALVERDRLMSPAMAGARTRLLLITAAAGYGKTSVLVQLYETLAQQRRQLCWISLDAADNDHVRFLAHLVAGLRGAVPTFGAELALMLGSAAGAPASVLRSRLLNELTAIDDDLYLFLDDYHAIADPEVRDTLAAILLAPLPRIHLLIATRNRNEMPVGRLLALGQMVEIGAAELAFSEVEAGQFIDNAGLKPLSRNQLARLRAQTEGWVASLQLAAIALHGVEDVTRFLDEFSGETRAVGEFLGEEVLRRQPEYLQQFLMETSILRRFNTGLVQAVTVSQDGRRILDEVEAKNLFIFSLDGARNWYRYHHLFADFLQRRLRDRQPAMVETLHRRAAEWLTHHAMPIEAIDHAFLAGDARLAGQLLDATCTDLFSAGQLTTLQMQAARLPREMLSRLPRLQLELSWDHELRWQFPAATKALASVREYLASTRQRHTSNLTRDERVFLESKLAHREMMLMLLKDRLSEAYDLAERWTAETPAEEPFMRASVGTTMMHADRERYSCKGAPAVAASLHQLFLAGGAHYGTVFHDSSSGLMLFMRGELLAAERVYERARLTAIALQGEGSRLTAMPTALLAELRYERGDLVAARDLLARHPHAAMDFGFTDYPIARFVTGSRLAFANGRHADAEDALAAGLQVAEAYGLQRLRAHLVNERVRQLLANGRCDEAADILDLALDGTSSAALMPCVAATTTDELRMLAWSRVCIARDEQAQALPVLRAWVAHTRERCCVRAMMRISAVLVRLHLSCGDLAGARRVLRTVLQLTPGDGFVRSFIDEGTTVVAALRDLLTGVVDSTSALARRLRDILLAGESPVARDPAGQAATAAAETGGINARELEIITLTAQGMATSDISAALGLTDSTVKWYWQRIFAKLEVNRRFAAVKLARHRRWIV